MFIKKAIEKTKKVLVWNIDLLFKKKILYKSSFSSPDFLIIGAAKAGTTSLFQYLATHPEVLPPLEKEIGFFMHKGANGLKWYLKHFPKKIERGNKITFEATPGYFFFKESPKRVYKMFPKMKLILLLRDPVQRAFSHWTFLQEDSLLKSNNSHITHLMDKRTFQTAVEQELTGTVPWIHQYLARGEYVNQLKRWYTFFPKDQILILDSEEMKLEPQKVLNVVAEFLGINSFPHDLKIGTKKVEGLLNTADKEKNSDLKVYNVTDYKEKIEPNLERQLRKYYRPLDSDLRELTGRTFSWMKT